MSRSVRIALLAPLAALVASLAFVAPPARAQATFAMTERATVLVALQPRKISGRSWDVDAGADPVLCLDGSCFRSNGLAAPARFMSGRRALGPIAALNFFGKAGSCTGKLVCAFRDVEMPRSLATLQIIDVDVDRHDRLQKRLVSIDRSCRLDGGELTCEGGAFTAEYSVWVIPEETAAKASETALTEALSRGMETARLAYAEEFLKSEQRALPDLTADFYKLVLAEDIRGVCRFDPAVIAATLEVAGLMARPGVRDMSVLERFLEAATRDDLLALIAVDPAGFWRLNDAIDQLHVLAVANTVERTGWGGGVGIEQQGAVTVLHVDPDIEAKSRAVIDRCIDGLPVAAGDGGEVRMIKRPKPKVKRHPVMPAPGSDPSVAPTLPLIDPDDAIMLTIIGRAP